MDIFPTHAGFLTMEGISFIMHEWRNGKIKWKVTPPNKKEWSEADSGFDNIDDSAMALSFDGQYFASSTVQKNGVRIQRWHNGKLDSDCTVLKSRKGAPTPARYKMEITNAGRIFLQYTYANRVYSPNFLLVLNGNRVIAEARMPIGASILDGGSLAYSEDKKINEKRQISDATIIYSIQVSEGKVLFKRLAGGCQFGYSQNNYIFAQNGAVYSSNGRILPPSTDRINNDKNEFCTSSCSTDTWLISLKEKKKYIISSLKSNQRMTFGYIPKFKCDDISHTGRYLLFVPDNFLESDKSITVPNETNSLRLYERSGVLRAFLRYDIYYTDPDEYCSGWILSPDGRSVILLYQHSGIGGEALLYRW